MVIQSDYRAMLYRLSEPFLPVSVFSSASLTFSPFVFNPVTENEQFMEMNKGL